MPERDAHVLVLGLGPAGRATAHWLERLGVDVIAVDPSPERRWTPTYAAWEHELPDWLPDAAISTRSPRPYAWARGPHTLAGSYVVLDAEGLRASLPVERTIKGTATAVGDHDVALGDGRSLRAEMIIDARGTRPNPALAQQTAVGVVVPRERATTIDGAWFMDWRRDNGTGSDDHPSFLYAIPLDDDHVLLEETCLVGRPALELAELRTRLQARLTYRGVGLDGAERIERVRFAVEPDHDQHPNAVGARAGIMHPATGYSVAASLRLAPAIADAVQHGRSPDSVLWPSPARATRRLRQIGLTTLLRLPNAGVEDFFAAFFALSPARQRTYLSEREHPVALLATMASMMTRLPRELTAIALSSALRPSVTSSGRDPAGR